MEFNGVGQSICQNVINYARMRQDIFSEIQKPKTALRDTQVFTHPAILQVHPLKIMEGSEIFIMGAFSL